MQKFELTTIQNYEPSISHSKDTASIQFTSNTELSNYESVQQLDSLLKKSTSEVDDLKSLLKEYLKVENKNISSSINKNVKFTSKKDKKIRKQIKPVPLTSNSESSMSSLNDKVKRKSKESQQIIDVKRKSLVIKTNKIIKSKSNLSDIIETNEKERKLSSSSTNRTNSPSSEKQYKAIKSPGSKKKISTSKKISKPCSYNENYQELMLNTHGKSGSEITVFDDEKQTYVQELIQKIQVDTNNLINPPNSVRTLSPDVLMMTEQVSDDNQARKKDSKMFYNKNIDKQKKLAVQILPYLDIKRSLTKHKLPEVVIEPCRDKINKFPSENIKYIEIMHNNIKYSSEENAPVICNIQNKDVCQTNDICIKTKEISREKDAPEKKNYNKSAENISSDGIEEIAKQPTKASNDTSSKNINNEAEEETASVLEELNLDINKVPSIRTLNEIQNYLEQRCALIRSRLHEESKLKIGETLSFRHKFDHSPDRQSSTEETEKNISISQKNPQPLITLSPLRTYSVSKTPLSPLRKIEQKKSSLKENKNKKLLVTKNSKNQTSPVKTVEKSLQVSEFMEYPILRNENANSSPLLSVETIFKNLDIHEISQTQTIAPCMRSDSIQTDDYEEITNEPHLNLDCGATSEVAIQTNLENLTKHIPANENVDFYEEKIIKAVDSNSNQQSLSGNQVTDIIEESPKVKLHSKQVTFKVVTNQFSLFPNENEETQVLSSDTAESPIEEMKEKIKLTEEAGTKQFKSENTQTSKSEDTQTSKNENTQTSKENLNIEKEDIKNSTITKESSNLKNTTECFTQCSPIEQEFDDVDKNISQYDDGNKNTSQYHDKQLSSKCHRNYYKSKLKNKKCSTPVSSLSSTSTAEIDLESVSVSLSDGEFKLPCECSTSIGEIHLCRFANDIRKKVRILKQNPEKVVKQSFGNDFKTKRQYKFNDNWFAYYVSKNESSSEQRTGSNLSSIKSNIETD